ncbi:glyoxylase I family protein [Paenibacillus taihuensis]|uniref:Glyoxylase I family protein n=1 Tax=Paenibacillus taihuensis TaxID=1156355 RepID=A0A3D9RR53_9BACL|nr:VOC family protein [Paenibacillus taihuensis]REE77683.1 glyoxylase I family protein [Paenibacillus taihuensis]
MTGKIKAFKEVGITVSNLERSVCFYRDLLGFEVLIPYSGVLYRPGTGYPNAWVQYTVLYMGDIWLELVQFLEPVAAYSRPLPLYAPTAPHLGFQVENIEQMYAEFAARGVQFVSPINIEYDGPVIGAKWVYFLDPDGVTLELFDLSGLKQPLTGTLRPSMRP